MCRGSDQSMPDCDHEEADSRICVHVSDALHKGAHDVLVRTVDTDVVVILVGSFFHRKTTYPDMNLWVGFGTGKHYRYYDITISTACASNLGYQIPLPYLSIMLLRDVTPHHNFLEREKRLLGIHGKHTQK